MALTEVTDVYMYNPHVNEIASSTTLGVESQASLLLFFPLFLWMDVVNNL